MLLTEYNEAETMAMYKKEGSEEGVMIALVGLVKDKLISISYAAAYDKMTEKEFAERAGLSSTQ